VDSDPDSIQLRLGKGVRMYEEMRRQHHPHCVVCGQESPHGWGLTFVTVADGMVEADFPCDRLLEGYPCVLHGGVICALLDGAMTNCLFAAGSAAVTGDIHVRFHQPVAAVGWARLRAWIEESASPLYKMAAQLEQEGMIRASARARFVERSATASLMREFVP
jgi:uncharacterized protein (TIGR00369 family)